MGRSLVERVRSGEVAAIARMLTRVEANRNGVGDDLAELYRGARRAHLIGVTGPPGSGKSTLVAALAAAMRRRGRSVGILAVDPTSAFTGGSVLGDRIRMAALSGDDGVFIRSMATHGALGGLARATGDAVTVLEAAGKDVVLIETVGVGQDEVEIARASHSTVLVSVPGMGDAVQAIKAGVMEIADVHVVNKADRDGADRLVAELRDMVRQGRYVRAAGWPVPIHRTVATDGDGVDELVDLLDQHRAWLVKHDGLGPREREIAASRLRNGALALLLARMEDPASATGFEALVDAVAERRLDPLTAASRLIDVHLTNGEETR
jgi:LAO/AO transport system kinase